jgi:hypothetical protein
MMYVMLEWTLYVQGRGGRGELFFFFFLSVQGRSRKEESGPRLSGPMRELGFDQEVGKGGQKSGLYANLYEGEKQSKMGSVYEKKRDPGACLSLLCLVRQFIKRCGTWDDDHVHGKSFFSSFLFVSYYSEPCFQGRKRQRESL